jgi:hypothetical protein
MSDCPTCGGSGVERFPRGDYTKSVTCPDCANGRQPSPEVLERMAEAITEASGWPETDEMALAAWLAEHREEQP